MRPLTARLQVLEPNEVASRISAALEEAVSITRQKTLVEGSMGQMVCVRARCGGEVEGAWRPSPDCQRPLLNHGCCPPIYPAPHHVATPC